MLLEQASAPGYRFLMGARQTRDRQRRRSGIWWKINAARPYLVWSADSCVDFIFVCTTAAVTFLRFSSACACLRRSTSHLWAVSGGQGL